MTPDRWRRIQTLFAAAEEFSSGELGAFLDRACADDPEMRAEIHALLQWRVDAGDFLNLPAEKFLNLRQASVALWSVQPSQGEVDLAGRKLGRYEIVERIGIGGMGIVYKARDKRLGRLLALKVLPAAKFADHDRKLRFVQEARAASALNHPNIITIYEIGEADDTTPYIAMEYIEGRAVRQLIADGDIPLKSVLAIAVQIADGLSPRTSTELCTGISSPKTLWWMARSGPRSWTSASQSLLPLVAKLAMPPSAQARGRSRKQGFWEP